MKVERSKTMHPGISIYTTPGRAPRYAARICMKPKGSNKKLGRYLGSFQTDDEALKAQTIARALLEKMQPLPPVVRWRAQLNDTGIRSRKFGEKTYYRYEINATLPDKRIKAHRSQWFASKGEAVVARTKALIRFNHGEPIGHDGLNWKAIRYPIEWIQTKVVPTPESNISVSEWSVIWITQVVNPAPVPQKWKNRYKAHLMRHIVPVLKKHYISKLDQKDVGLVDNRLKQRNMGESIKSVRTTFWRLIESAIANGIRSDNPVLDTPITDKRLAYQHARSRSRVSTESQQIDPHITL